MYLLKKILKISIYLLLLKSHVFNKFNHHNTCNILWNYIFIYYILINSCIVRVFILVRNIMNSISALANVQKANMMFEKKRREYNFCYIKMHIFSYWVNVQTCSKKAILWDIISHWDGLKTMNSYVNNYVSWTIQSIYKKRLIARLSHTNW